MKLSPLIFVLRLHSSSSYIGVTMNILGSFYWRRPPDHRKISDDKYTLQSRIYQFQTSLNGAATVMSTLICEISTNEHDQYGSVTIES